jgi:hypothetical protein
MKLILLSILALSSSLARAQNIHFFGSVTAAKTNVEDNDISFDSIKNKATVTPLTTAGVSFDATVSEKYQALAQFIYKNQTSMGVDLLQLRTNIAPGLTVRLGRQRLPTNLHSENIQVQALLPWMNAPREVYGRAPIYSFTGASFEKSLGDYVNLHFYGGDTRDEFINENITYKTAAKNLIGGRLNLNLEHFKAFVNLYRAEATIDLNTRVDTSGSLGAGTNIGYTQANKLENVNGFTTGFKYHPKSFFIMSEYTLLSSKNPLLERIDGAYLSAGKELGESWVAVATFSTDLHIASQLAPTKTSTYAFNMNYRLDLNNMIKFGVEHINYKERTVATSATTTSNASVFTNGSPGENFEIYSVMWAFVY